MIWFFALAYLLYAVGIIAFYRQLLKKFDHRKLYIPNVPEEFEPFQRYDRVNWCQWEIYFCAVFLLPIRIFFIFITLIGTYLVLLIGSIGVPLQQEWPLDRYRIVKKAVNVLATFYMFFSGFYIIPTRIVRALKVKYSDFDPDYTQEPEDKVRRPSIIVSNHFSWYDTIFYVSRIMPSFLSKEAVQFYPVFGKITIALKSIFLKRDSAEDRNQVTV